MKTPLVKYIVENNTHVIDFDIPAMGKIEIDFNSVPEESRAGIAKALLSAATLACYSATLTSALDARGASLEKLEAEAQLELGMNKDNLPRVTGIQLNTEVTLAQSDEDVFNRCQKIMRNGCLVTASVHEGVHMNYDLKAKFK